MPIFEYEGLNAAGRLMTGTLEAADNAEARAVLGGMGLTVNSLVEGRPARPLRPISRGEFLLFNQQLASIAEAGIPLERSLRELSADVRSGRMRKLIEAIAGDLEAGATIEQAFEKRKAHFPPLYDRILAAGIRTGRLGEMLTSLNRHLETGRQTRRIVLESACYPAIVLALTAGIATFLLAVVVPRFAGLVGSLTAQGLAMAPGGRPAVTPAVTSAVFAVSRHLGRIWICLGAFAAAVVVVKVAAGRFPAGRRAVEQMGMNVPVLGRIYRNSVLARLADAMAALVSAGVDMPSCLRLGASATGSAVMRHECEAAARGVEAGERLYVAGGGCKVIPKLFLYSMEWGGDRGELADNLYGLAEMHAEQARTNQARLRAVMMPVLLLVVGLVVGVTAVAMFAPFVTMLKNLVGGIQAL